MINPFWHWETRRPFCNLLLFKWIIQWLDVDCPQLTPFVVITIWCLLVINWFLSPSNYSCNYHSYCSYLAQLSYLTGAPLCNQPVFVGALMVIHDLDDVGYQPHFKQLSKSMALNSGLWWLMMVNGDFHCDYCSYGPTNSYFYGLIMRYNLSFRSCNSTYSC